MGLFGRKKGKSEALNHESPRYWDDDSVQGGRWNEDLATPAWDVPPMQSEVEPITIVGTADFATAILPVPPKSRIAVFEDEGGKWRWRLQLGNNKKFGVSGESFARRANAMRAADRLSELIPGSVVVVAVKIEKASK